MLTGHIEARQFLRNESHVSAGGAKGHPYDDARMIQSAVVLAWRREQGVKAFTNSIPGRRHHDSWLNSSPKRTFEFDGVWIRDSSGQEEKSSIACCVPCLGDTKVDRNVSLSDSKIHTLNPPFMTTVNTERNIPNLKTG